MTDSMSDTGRMTRAVRAVLGEERRHPSPWLAPGLAMLIPLIGGAIAYGVLQERVENLRTSHAAIRAELTATQAQLERRVETVTRSTMPRLEIDAHLTGIRQELAVIREEVQQLRRDLALGRQRHRDNARVPWTMRATREQEGT